MKLTLIFLIPCMIYGGITLTVSGNPQPLIISTATAGQEPRSIIDSSTTYKIKVKKVDRASISGALSEPLPNHTSLKVTFSAPQNATSIPSVELTTTPQTLVSGINEGNYNNLTITYEYLAKVAAGIVSLSSKTLILTVTDH